MREGRLQISVFFFIARARDYYSDYELEVKAMVKEINVILSYNWSLKLNNLEKFFYVTIF